MEDVKEVEEWETAAGTAHEKDEKLSPLLNRTPASYLLDALR